MQRASMVARALGALIKWKRRTLVVRLIFVRQCCFMHALQQSSSTSRCLSSCGLSPSSGRLGAHPASKSSSASQRAFRTDGFITRSSVIGTGVVRLTYRRVIASAQWLPLTIALSRLGGHPVSVQAPATSKLAIGLRWIGRCNFAPGLSERMAPAMVRWWVEAIVRPGARRPNNPSRSGMSVSSLESGRACAN